MKKSPLAAAALIVAAVLVAEPVPASVTQVDGTIVPTGTGMQTALNAAVPDGEGVAPPNATAIDAVRDGELTPEIFLPDELSAVTFQDVAEGAGFENSFGYYNVGDDVTNPVNLHPILGCDPTRATQDAAFPPAGSRYVPGYIKDAEPNAGVQNQAQTGGDTVVVNFATERTSGRWRGGFIGFYFQTPVGGSCDSANGTTGRTYFTQRDLNNDGDFVHLIIYRSKINTKRFYFGAEDLFRGGDNDFEDMATQVTGLTPPCIPVAETCNNADDDCDGTPDDPPVAGTGGVCTAGLGICTRSGTIICQGGGFACNAVPGPSEIETCDGEDDDCDGTADNNNPVGTGTACTEGVGACRTSGSLVCLNADLQCIRPIVGPTAELCDGIDNDCDGQTDEDFNVGTTCDGLGACGPGVIECASPTTTRCSSDDEGVAETCNGLDDDCDGTPDNHLTDVGVACELGIGQCRATGITFCNAGTPQCNAVPGAPAPELCNGLDENCNGTNDDGFGLGAACDGVGECPIGAIECATSNTTRCSTDIGGSGYVFVAESCDTKDNDCDGASDEGLSDLGPCPGGTDTGECDRGRQRCRLGNVECVGAITPTPEFCDNKDNDCNSATDDDPIDVDIPCGTSAGRCELGNLECQAGGNRVCVGGVGPATESCNGVDDDCDGFVDNNLTGFGVACGTARPAPCQQGTLECVAGAAACVGEVLPGIETCNDIDDDCDGTKDNNLVDIGGVCGVGPGICSPGTFVCNPPGMRVCQGAVSGPPETCNGLDDDCNGLVDDNVPGFGVECGTQEGSCEPGRTACIAGTTQCVGGRPQTTEVCDGIDNDCDGVIDDGDLCQGAVCMQGQCALPCADDEFACPPGRRCVADFCLIDPCYDVRCPRGAGGELNVCREGECVDACSLATCTAPNVCRPSDGVCVPNSCTFLPELCTATEVCQGGACVFNPCSGKSCADGEFCRPTDGQCVKSCASVVCGDAQRCEEGVCVATGCDVSCAAGQVCADGRCVSDPCRGRTCPAGQVCDGSSGSSTCVNDPCTGLVCPTGQTCRLGNCYAPGTTVAVLAAGGGGCSVGGGGDSGAALLFLIALAALALRKRRWLAAILFLASCNVDPYYLNFDGDGGPGQGTVDANGGGGVDGRPDAPTVCTPGAPEECDGVDNNCDGVADEGFDYTSDFRNCGGCGNSCAVAGAQSRCESSSCQIQGCFPGFIDVNGDLGNGFGNTDGCEYVCFPSNMGVEACDGLDNDCDTQVDEDFDKTSDEQNCGQCGRVCQFFHATATCQNACSFDPANDCDPGYYDIDGRQDTGCEYACTATGAETCDFVDNDCDGVIDDGFAPYDGPTNCGVCGRTCSFPHVATPRCVSAGCTYTAPADCEAGFVDVNGNKADGCEYACTVSSPVNRCDGVDNDCDRQIDEADELVGSVPAVGLSCGPATEEGACQFGTTKCLAGTVACDGAIEPRAETCDGTDEDCDGQADDVDDNLIDENRICAAAVGQCSFGISVCNGTALTCDRDVGPSPEICDGIDNDCNGVPDNNLTDTGVACGGGLNNTAPAQCRRGSTVCTAGTLICSGAVAPSPENCDGIDNDCNGPVDDNVPLVGSACGSGVGDCEPGTYTCNGVAGLSCVGGTGPAVEICNGEDDDCTGIPDDNLGGDPRVGAQCGTGVGQCTFGTQVCAGGAIACSGAGQPTGEICDNVNNDCDGATDEDPAGLPLSRACYSGPQGTLGVGVCRGGTQTCTSGSFPVACAGEKTPEATEICDGEDDDCDTLTDEGPTGLPLTQACYTGPGPTRGVGACHDGTQTCTGGTYTGATCVNQALPTSEICGNAIDDDCDNNSDTSVAEGCLLVTGGETRLDAIVDSTGATGSGLGVDHSFDVDIATAGTRVYAAFADARDGAATPQILLARSGDGGVTWGTSLVQVSCGAATTSPRVIPITAGGVNYVFVVYIELSGSQSARDLRVARGVDNGTTVTFAHDCNNIDNQPVLMDTGFAIQAVSGAELREGETFTISDGIHPAKTFEFDLNGDGGQTAGSVVISVLPETAAALAGTGNALAKAGSTMTLTDAETTFPTSAVGKQITIAGASNGANNGTFTITARTANSVSWINAAGAAQGTYGGRWTIAAAGSSNGTTDSISAPAAGIQTLDTNEGQFNATFHPGKLITVTGASNAANNGTFVITGSPSVTQVSYRNPAGVAQANTFNGSWRIHASIAMHARGDVLDENGANDDVTLTNADANVLFVTGFHNVNQGGQRPRITISGGNGNNSGSFDVTAIPSTTSVRWVDADAVDQNPFPGVFWLVRDTNALGTANDIDQTSGNDDTTLIDAEGGFSMAHIGKSIRITGTRNGENSGQFIITDVLNDGTRVRWLDADAIDENTTTGTWSIWGNGDDVAELMRAAIQAQISGTFQVTVSRSGDVLTIGGAQQITETVADSTFARVAMPSDSFHYDVAAEVSGTNIHLGIVWEELDVNTVARDIRVRRANAAEAATFNQAVFNTGATVNQSELVNRTAAGLHIAGRPRAVYGNSGRLVFVWREQRSPATTADVFTSFWDAASTTASATDLRIDADPLAPTTGADDLPVLARIGSEIYVAWQEVQQVPGTPPISGGDIFFARSTNNGTSYSAQVELDDPGSTASNSLSPQIAAILAGGQNRVYVAWQDSRAGTEIFVARSVDGGASFGTGTRGSAILPTPGVNRDHRIAVDAGGPGAGRVYLVYTNSRNGLRDVFASFSLDAGVTWQPLDLRLDADTAGSGTSNAPAFGLLPSGGGVTAWLDFRGDAAAGDAINGDIYARRILPP